jgi:hypothetical protein
VDFQDFNNRLQSIEERNKRVEAGKAWETSLTRVSIISLTTYVIAVIFLLAVELPNPFLSAFVPAIGWILSIQSLPFVKRWWIKRR